MSFNAESSTGLQVLEDCELDLVSGAAGGTLQQNSLGRFGGTHMEIPHTFYPGGAGYNALAIYMGTHMRPGAGPTSVQGH